MPNRPKLIHLIIILTGLGLLAAGAWYYTNAQESVAGIPENAIGGLTPQTPSQALDAVLYFPNAALGSDQDCGKVFPVHRAITDTVNDSPYLELLKGPTADELKLGYLTSIPAGVTINSITKRVAANGVQVLIDFSAQMNKTAGSCRVTSIRAQVEQTAKGIDPTTPTDVILSVNGDAASALQP